MLVKHNALKLSVSPSSAKTFGNIIKCGAKMILKTIKHLMGDSGENFLVVPYVMLFRNGCNIQSEWSNEKIFGIS